mgnify:FL=1
MRKTYLRPLLISAGPDAIRLIAAGDALPLAGGSLAFAAAEVIERTPDGSIARRILRVEALPRAGLPAELARLTAPRAGLGDLDLASPRLMGILNVTPDSFSDGGRHETVAAAIDHGLALIGQGAAIVDIGGESTRPGALPVPADIEEKRVLPVIAGLKGRGALLSIDSRNAQVMAAAVAAGCGLINDVQALAHDPSSPAVARTSGVPVVLMHALGDPRTMQDDPRYADVLLDVYDALAARIQAAEAAGIARERLLLDPGIGFGKRPEHNLALLAGLGLFHGLGLPIVLGASRKSVIAHASRGEGPENRLGGTIAINLRALAQGVQVLRVHDVAAAAQALALWRALDRYSGAVRDAELV